MKNLQKTHEFTVLYFFLLLIGSHLCPSIFFLINLFALIVLHLKKNNKLRNLIGFFLFIFWPCCFYIYLSCFVNAVVSDGSILLQNYESPYYIKINLETFTFWLLRFSTLSSVKCPILGFNLNPIYFKRFLFETYYCVALTLDIVGLSFTLKIW